MQGTMTWVGMDVHARSTHAAAVMATTGELRRVRFGVGYELVVAWLRGLPAPVRACYEAGPTGYGLARAAQLSGVAVEVIAPSKTPRAPGERIKTDRRDAELLVRLLMAGQLHPVAIPTPSVEALRDLTRSRDRIRADLLRAATASPSCCCATGGCGRLTAAPGRRHIIAGWSASTSTIPISSWPTWTRWRLCGALNGRLWLFRDGMLHVVANCGAREGYEYDLQHPKVPDRSSMAGRAALTRAIAHLADVDADPE